jgi:hypothetical protein
MADLILQIEASKRNPNKKVRRRLQDNIFALVEN